MRNRFARATAAIALAVILSCAGCASQADIIAQQQEKLVSLAATTQLIADDWLGGSVGGTYAKTALEQTFLQVEQQRARLVRTPTMLLDPRAAALSQQAEQLSRLIAQVQNDVARGDGWSLRQRLGALPLVPAAK